VTGIGPSHFLTTAWSEVLACADRSAPAFRERIDRLCERYWRPVYHYLRRRRCSPVEAEDLTQSFFAEFLEKNLPARADPAKGRFRTFVLTVVERLLGARRRRSGRERAALEKRIEEEEARVERFDAGLSPEEAFNRAWARSLVERTLERLEAVPPRGRGADYLRVFRVYLERAAAGEAPSYALLGALLDLSETDVTNALHRGRALFGRALRQEVAESVAREEDIEPELEELRAFLGG